MTISIEYEAERKLDLPYEEIIHDMVLAALDYEGCPYEAEVNLLLVDNDIIHELNLEHRGIDRATDVLSFPMLDYQEAGDFSAIGEEQEWNCNPDTGEILLGDIIISVPKVLEQAKEYGHSPKREFAFLITHSMLHLFGYDHMEPEEAAIMENKQEKILEVLGISR